MSQQAEKSRVVFVCSEDPEQGRGGAALRDASLIRMMKSLDYAVDIVLTLDLPHDEAHWFRKARYLVDPYFMNGWSTALVEKLRSLQSPGAVLWLSRLHHGRYGEFARSLGYRVVLDEHNVESQLYIESVLSSPAHWAHFPLAYWMRYWEKKLCSQAQAVVCTTARDRMILESSLGVAPVRVIPNCVDGERYRQHLADGRLPSGRLRLAFIGTLNYTPNTEGITWYLTQVWPLVRAKWGEHITLLVAGSRPTEHLQTLVECSPGVELRADFRDVHEIIKDTDVLVVPVQSGSGSRLKIIEALAAGLPVVTTKKGFEGLEVQGNPLVFEAQSVEENVSALDLLRKNYPLAADRKQGSSLILKNNDWRAHVNTMALILGGSKP